MIKLFLILFVAINIIWIVSQNSYAQHLIAELQPSPTPNITPFPSADIPIMDSPIPTPTVAPTALPKIEIKQPESSALLPLQQYVYQTYNNCGPATLSMVLDFYGINRTQQQIADQLRPYNNPQGYNDDKSVVLDELAAVAREQGLVAYKRPNGDLEKIKKFIANGIPVTTITWIDEKGGFGHYRIVKGFDDNAQQIIQDDSIFGQGKKVSYSDFLRLWQVFNYDYLVIVPKDKTEIVKALLADELTEKNAYAKSLERSQLDDHMYAIFNQSINYYYLGEYQNAVNAFEQVKSQLPYRLLWYQIEPILAYQKLKNYDKVYSLTDEIIKSGNPSFSELYQVRGESFLDQGKTLEAKIEFEKAIKFNKNHQPAIQALSKMNS